MTPTHVWLARHAETAWSITRRHTGRTDLPLTEDGRAAAATLRPVLAGRDWSLVLCSPLQRARETADLAGVGDRVQLRDDLLEWDYGEAEGLTTEEVREQQPGWLLWRDGAPGGEAPEDVTARADRVVEELLAIEGEALVVAHSHLLRVLAARWVEQPAAFGQRLPLPTAGVSVLGWEREARAIVRWGTPPG
ncbi:histidine phosphatase family protein [Conexibacter sp. SYSU D00693]|uniref:histidine phosphatase family protein n=1 Tax=Conexibacter sp. SYSU D00693 TaxID=2812560 RepID=UPI00196AA784|nr:histidine phosphatase family protein [Conexibacter sp. SYSU D00693]